MTEEEIATTKVWYHTDSPTEPISFGKFLPSYPGEEFFEEPLDLLKEDIKDYTIEWVDVLETATKIPRLVKKSDEEITARKDAEELERYKRQEREVIVREYVTEREKPVTVAVDEGTFTFNGGQDSASYINGAIGLAQALNEPTVIITDIDNVAREVSYASAQEIVVTIGKIFRDHFFTKQGKLVALGKLDKIPKAPAPNPPSV